MNKITLIITFLAFSFFSNAQILNYNLNDIVDDFTVTDIHGVEHNLYSYTSQGKYVFLDFFFDTCSPCQQTSPIYNEFYDKYGCNESDVICITMNNGSDSDAEVEAFEETYGGDFNHAPAVSADGGAGAVDANLNPAAYPTICLINPNNQIINLDIWPVSGVETFEAAFPTGFNPTPMECTILNTNDYTNSLNFNIFPNPSNGKNFTINLEETINNATVTIVDIIGKQLFSKTYSTSVINLDLNLTSGTYLINVKSNNVFSTRKLIVR